MIRDGSASDKQRKLGPKTRDETISGEWKEDALVKEPSLMERILARENLRAALRQVENNKGAPGIDGMTVEQLRPYLKEHWPKIKESLLNGTYKPKPVLRKEIPKESGGVREIGIPCVLDRFIQQAILQVLQEEIDKSFSEHSFGFRPNRSAHQAIAKAQEYIQQGYTFVVDIDLEKFFDNVNQDLIMQRLKAHVKDVVVLKLINSFLRAGVCIQGQVYPTTKGTVQGGPLSPLLANLLLDDLDKELEHRGHRFVRYADDCNIYVKSKRAAKRVMASIAHYLETRLKLRINTAKSAVDRPWYRTFLGFTFTRCAKHRRKVSDKALDKFKQRIRKLSQRVRGISISSLISELRKFLIGWKAYFSFTQVPSPLRDLDKWIRRRLRCYLWKQWGRKGYRELLNRGVDQLLAWNTAKSAHGPWRLSKSPALCYALPDRYLTSLGLPSLVKG